MGDVSHERTTGILKKAIENQTRMTLIESVVSQGETASMVLTLSARSVWLEGNLPATGMSGSVALGEDWLSKGENEDEEDKEVDIDEEKLKKVGKIIEIMARGIGIDRDLGFS